MYVKLLSEHGDVIEKRAVNEFGLGEKFPRYAEFWAKYIFPNRDPSDASKLHNEFPIELEDIANNHYSAFYHLTYAYAQIAFLSAANDEANTILDIANPLYHLATAAELVERTFVAVFRQSKTISIKRMTKRDFYKHIREFREKYYDKYFKEFLETFRNVTMSFHDVRALFNEAVPKNSSRTSFNTVADKIRKYRNKLIHGVAPLRLISNGKICIPKDEYLKDFINGRWSSDRAKVQIDHYAPAVEIIQELADELVKALNGLWEILIKEVAKLIPVPTPEVFFTPDGILFNGMMMGHASGVVISPSYTESGQFQTNSGIFLPPDHRPKSDGDPLM